MAMPPTALRSAKPTTRCVSAGPHCAPSAQKMRRLLPEVHDRASGNRENVAQALPDSKDKIEEQNLLHRAMMASDDNRISDARRALEKALQLDANSPTALRQL